MKKSLVLAAVLALPMAGYSLPAFSADEPAGSGQETKVSDEAKAAMMEDCKGAADMDKCMSEKMSAHMEHMKHESGGAMQEGAATPDKEKTE